jgi:hypothetical protein
MRRLAIFVLVALVLVIGISCADSPDSKRTTKILAPDQSQFENFVSPFLERKCATLDCHGQVGRPLRLYSGRGLRLPGDGGVYPGSSDTTGFERTANYRAVIGLEPELISRVEAGLAKPRDLLLLQKPLGLGTVPDSHKGGQVLAPMGDPGEACLSTWLLAGANNGGFDSASCTKAAGGF